MPLEINSDFTKRIVITPDDYQWTQSPMPGVERMMLDRIGDEVARATTIVRYAPNSTFSAHNHDGGEEFFILEGTFSDEHGERPAGTYIRNPIGTSHTPKIGKDGATIFVKLHQVYKDDDAQLSIDTTKEEWLTGVIPGLSMMPLHAFKDEHVALMQWAPNLQLHERQVTGEEEVQEILVLKGTFHDEHGSYPTGSWLRLPPATEYTPYTKADGATIYIKAYKAPTEYPLTTIKKAKT